MRATGNHTGGPSVVRVILRSNHPAIIYMNAAKWNRKLHRWGAVIIALPLIIVVASGLLLQFKKQSDWIQPPTRTGSPGELTVGFDRILGWRQQRRQKIIAALAMRAPRAQHRQKEPCHA